MKRLIVTGATGFIGRELCRTLCNEYRIIALTRNQDKASHILGPAITPVQWAGRGADDWPKYIEGAFGIVNLAGENIASGRWTAAKRQRIRESRINITRMLFEAAGNLREKPSVVIQASAIGYYGPRCEDGVDESAPCGQGFLADVCKQWEEAGCQFESLSVRTVIIRSGAVLNKEGGVLSRLVMPFRRGIGLCPGSGEQWLSWIAMEDEIAAIRFLLENETLCGQFNLTCPHPIRMSDLCAAIADATGGRYWIRIPAVALHLGSGKMADELLMASQRVIPRRLCKAGFHFGCCNVEQLLEGIRYGEKSRPC